MSCSFNGKVDTTLQALQVIYAAHQSIIPRTMTPVSDPESIKSGAVFVFCEEESGIKHWTDGLKWSPSRMDGNFQVCRQMEDDFWSVDMFTFGPLSKKFIEVNLEGYTMRLVAYYDPWDETLELPTEFMSLRIPTDIFCKTKFISPPVGLDGETNIVESADTEPEAQVSDPRVGAPTSTYIYPLHGADGSRQSKKRDSQLSSPPFHTQADRHTSFEAPKDKRQRQKSQKSRGAREGGEEGMEQRGNGMLGHENPNSSSSVQPWPYSPPAFVMPMPMPVIPYVLSPMYGPSQWTKINSGNHTHINIYDSGNNNSTNQSIRKVSENWQQK